MKIPPLIRNKLISPTLPIGFGLLISCILGAFVTWSFYWPAGNGIDKFGQPIGQDFINIWAGSKIVLHDNIGIVFDRKAYYDRIQDLYGHRISFYNWSYPLYTVLLYGPFSLAPYLISLALWTAAGLAVWLGVYRAYAGHWKTSEVAILVLSPACFMNVTDGQNGFFTASLFVGGLLLVRKYPVYAGILFGLLTFKPQLGIVLPVALAAMRAWKTIAAAGATLLVLVVGTGLVFGFASWWKYFTIVSPMQAGLLMGTKQFYSYMMVSPFNGIIATGLDPVRTFSLQTIFFLAAIGMACECVRRTDDVRRQILVLCSAVPLISPYIFNYDLCLVTLPLTYWLMNEHTQTRRRWLYIAAWLAPISGMFLAMLLARWMQIIVPLSLIGLFLATVADIDRIKRPSKDGNDAALALE